MTKIFNSLAVAGILLGATTANAQPFTKKYADERDHAHYSIENYAEDLFMGGTTFEPGSLTDTDIHAKRLDGSGNVVWEQKYDIGDEERCIDIALYDGEDMVITGTTKVGGDNRIFVLRIEQSTGNLINQILLNPGPAGHIEQTPSEIIYSATTENYYLSGFTFDYSTTPHPTFGEGLLFSLDVSLNLNWTKETPGAITAIEEIDGVGIFVGSATNSAVNYSGNLIWQINSGDHAIASTTDAEYDAASDRIIAITHNSLLEITGASAGGASLNQIIWYADNTADYRNIQNLDLELNANTNELVLLQVAEEDMVAYRNYNPCVIHLDLTTLNVNQGNVTRTHNPGAYYFDEDARYAFGHSMQLSDWVDDFGVVYFEHPDFGMGAPNEYDVKILRTNSTGASELSCEEEIPMQQGVVTPIAQTATSFTTISYSTTTPAVTDLTVSHTLLENCFNFEPCSINISHLIVDYTDCYTQDYSVSYTANPGTVITGYTWNWGDGSSTTTTNPNTTHTFSSGACSYTVCVTVNAVGTDGSTCSDTHCQTVLMLNDEGCEPCGEGRSSIQPGNSGTASEMDFTVAPNPSNGNFAIELVGDDMNGQFVLLNAIGQVVYTSENIQGNYFRTTIDGSTLEEGVYLLQFRNANEVITKKLIKI